MLCDQLGNKVTVLHELIFGCSGWAVLGGEGAVIF